jgi:uncharacterized membrane protein SirB2
MNYLFLKYLHIFCVASSFSLFFVRGLWVMRAYPPPGETWVKVLPHVIDTLLVLSAVGMLASVPRLEWPGWMQVKLGLLVIYVLFAIVVFRAGRNLFFKVAAWIGGMLLFLYITTVAVLQHPLGVFSLF